MLGFGPSAAPVAWPIRSIRPAAKAIMPSHGRIVPWDTSFVLIGGPMAHCGGSMPPSFGSQRVVFKRNEGWDQPMRGGDAMQTAYRAKAKGRGVLCAMLVVLAVALAAGKGMAQADSGWSGAYLGLGLVAGTQRVALDRLEARINGGAVSLSPPHFDAGLLLLGSRAALGGVVFGPELELQTGRSALSRTDGCVLGQVCARAGLVGEVGPVVRLRARIGWDIAPGVLFSAGAGVSLADLAIRQGFAQAATAQPGSAVLNRASSPFLIEDMVSGAHAVLGLERQIGPRMALRMDVMRERLWVPTEARLFIFTATATGASTAVARIEQVGGFALGTSSLRISLVMRF